ncbi:class I SAM-dependent methyltransferase [Micromonospora sp. KC606]|uniref:class I SAM-dependent methyltransferase n=1 Tax=Micromonospora sp. KC606 TaxID=2530379 RepID=UPI0014050F6A|nr:class I SAM-dependent methyltransferase [Micromonospora sp. KC606]
MADQTHVNAGSVDAFVDEPYLDTCVRAWEVTTELAQSILEALDLGAVDPTDEHRMHCVDWLRRAATYRMPSQPSRLADSSAEALAPTVDLLRHAASAYPRFLDGTASGQSILLSGEGMRLWNGYFQSRNCLYEPLNAAAAATVNRILRTGNGTRILEVGAGTGGATAHLLAEWPNDLSGAFDYTVTDTSASLLVSTRRAHGERAPSNVRLRFRRFDFDLVDDQGLVPRSFDLVLAVNALHNAVDLPSTLRNLRSLLRPGGTLVLSESLCAAGDLVHQEFIFNLLPMPADAYSRGSRFYAEAGWRAHFDAAGIAAEIQVNAVGPELVMVAVAPAEAEP